MGGGRRALIKPFTPPRKGWVGTALPQDTSAPVSGLFARTNPELGEGSRALSTPRGTHRALGMKSSQAGPPPGGGYTGYRARLSSPRDPAHPEPAGCLTQQLGTVLTASSRKNPPGTTGASPRSRNSTTPGRGAGADPSISTGSVGVSPSLSRAGAVFLTALFGASPPAKRPHSEPRLLPPPSFAPGALKAPRAPGSWFFVASNISIL